MVSQQRIAEEARLAESAISPMDRVVRVTAHALTTPMPTTMRLPRGPLTNGPGLEAIATGIHEHGTKSGLGHDRERSERVDHGIQHHGVEEEEGKGHLEGRA